MKLERLSENQIRCTLYKSDLADKQVMLTELAYGTEKAKELFRELMQQASDELGFEVDNIPLMIEAIPVSQECLILIITKVEDPEELDTRFSRFTKPIANEIEIEDDEDEGEDYEEPDDMSFSQSSSENIPSSLKNSNFGHLLETIGDLAGGLMNAANQAVANNPKNKDEKIDISSKDRFRVYAFKTLDDVIISAKLVYNLYKSENTLYKNPQDSKFYLYMTKDMNSEIEFAKCCNMVSEYGNSVRTTYSTKAHMEEHYKIIIDCNALQTLAKL